jgi:hypothetical protein
MPPPPLRALALIEEDCRLVAIYPLIGAMPARAGRKINRIEIGTQMMARYAGGLFNLQHMLAGQAFGALQPFPDGCLRNSQMVANAVCEPAISTACINASRGGF